MMSTDRGTIAHRHRSLRAFAYVARGLVIATVAMSTGCGGLTYWDSTWRDQDMARITSFDPESRAEALRDRIHRDAMRAHWFEYPGPGPLDTSEWGLASVRLWAPAIHDIAEGYAQLGDALREEGDLDGALAAYDQALTLSKENMIDGARAVAVRRTVYGGQARLWLARGERERAMAARLLSEGAEQWLASPDADDARAAYDRLIQASVRAQNAIAARAAARQRQQVAMALNHLNTQLQQTQQQYANQSQNGTANQSAQQMLQTMQVAVRITEITVRIADGGFENIRLDDLGFILDRFPTLRRALRDRRIQDFISTAEGQATLGDLYQTLEKLSRGREATIVAGLGRVAKASGATTRFERELERLDQLWAAGRMKPRKYWMALWELGVPDDLLTRLKKLEHQKTQGEIDRAQFKIDKQKLIQQILSEAPPK